MSDSRGRDRAAASLERLSEALNHPTRRRILLEFYRDARPRTVDEVAAFAGIHRTVAFDHLEQLARLRYLTKGKRAGRLGKPAALYALAGEPLEARYPPRRFPVLAALLAEGLASLGGGGRDAARRAGAAFGRSFGRPGATDVADAVRGLDALDGDYAVEDGRVVARTCVFLEACAAAPDVVCDVHAGVIEGALRASGLEAEVRPCGGEVAGSCSYAVTLAGAARG